MERFLTKTLLITIALSFIFIGCSEEDDASKATLNDDEDDAGNYQETDTASTEGGAVGQDAGQDGTDYYADTGSQDASDDDDMSDDG